MTVMKRQGSGRVLTFAVTGALLGGMGGCSYRPPGGKFVNPGPSQPPEPSVNPGPTDVTEAPPEPEPTEPEPAEPEYVNEGPVEEPPAEAPPNVMVNTVKQPEPPDPSTLEPGTMNVRKVEEEPGAKRARKPK